MQLADHFSTLGTETAFAVSAEVNAFARDGNSIYPFHLGDINIKTPENIIQATVRAMGNGKTGYCPSQGLLELRELIAKDINQSHGTRYSADNVSIQPGGKPVINKFLLALMNPGDEVLYPNPGYPIYESLTEFNGGKAVPYQYREGSTNFAVNIDQLCRSITPKTRILLFNNQQNPTGAESDQRELEQIADIVRQHDLTVLSDESYWDIRYQGKSLSIVSLSDMQERSVILYSFSKKYAMTGWRLGAAIGPREIIDAINKLNVNHESCTNHFVQCGAVEALAGPQDACDRLIQILKERRDRAAELLNSMKGIICLVPQDTFYLFPNVTELMKRMGIGDYETFRKIVLTSTGVSFCTRLHFGKQLQGEINRYIRLAYSGINVADIEIGLQKFKRFAESY